MKVPLLTSTSTTNSSAIGSNSTTTSTTSSSTGSITPGTGEQGKVQKNVEFETPDGKNISMVFNFHF